MQMEVSEPATTHIKELKSPQQEIVNLPWKNEKKKRAFYTTTKTVQMQISIQIFKQRRFFQTGAHREESSQSTSCNSVTQHPLLKTLKTIRTM